MVSKFTERILDVLINRPDKIETLRNYSYNKGHLVKELNFFFGRDLGYEIECTDSLSLFARKDAELGKKFDKLKFKNYNDDFTEEFCEHRIRIAGYRNIKDFYKLCNLLSENCKLNPGGGVHIHVNNPNKISLNRQKLYDPKNELLNHFKEEIFQYKGNYNPIIYDNRKPGAILNRQSYSSIEFRMGHCTFNFRLLIKWGIITNLYMNAIENNAPYDFKLSRYIINI